MLVDICGVMIWPLGRYKDAIVMAASCLEGELTLETLFALVLHVL